MTTTLLKKDYTIIGTSVKNPHHVIVEMDKDILARITSRRKITQKEVSLRDYIKSGEIDEPTNISRGFWTVDALIKSMQ